MRDSWSTFLIFLSIVLLIAGLIHLFLYKGLVRGLGISSPTVLWSLRAAAVLLALSYVLARWMDSWAPDSLVTIGHWTASIWLGLMWHMLWVGLLLWFGKTLLRIVGIWSRLEAHHAMLGKTAVVLVAGAAVVLGAIGAWRAYRPARVRTAAIPVKAITPEIAGLKIVMIADFHAGVLVGKREIDRWVGEINALKPDLILVPGDIVDHPPDRMPAVAESFSRLSARLGVFASTGNHEYIVGRRKSVAFLEKSGMRILANGGVEVVPGLLLAGIEDASAPRFGGTLKPIEEVLGPDAKTKATILLNHTPGSKAADSAIANGADLVVSGHTHGGQVWPWHHVVKLAFPLFHGLYEVGGGHQLTTCGIGFWGPPMRLGADPEMWVITLTE
jgi:predicted MPP superfamily phosphohydrolase